MQRISLRFAIGSGAAALAMVAVGFMVAATSAPSGHSATSTLTVEGNGSANLVPDTAEVTLGDSETAKTAQAALNASNRVTARIIQAVEALKVPARDIETSGINVSPTYGQSPDPNPPVTGYDVSNMLTIQVTPDRVGQVIDVGVKAGGNQVNGINFSVKNVQAAYQTAYAGALRDAKEQAEAIVRPLHEHLAGIRSITTQTNGGPVTFHNAAFTAAAPSVPVMSGQSTYSATVTVVYRVER